MIHLRIVAPPDCTQRVMDLLCDTPVVINVVHLQAAARRPDGDVILCDIAREAASMILDDLKELGIPERGSIAVEAVDFSLGLAADAADAAAPGLPTDAVVWEEVESRTNENTELSLSFVLFMIVAMQIAVVGIVLDQPILIVGAMVVGPEFGPLAGFSVAVVNRQKDLAQRSLRALAVGFALGIVGALVTTAVFIETGVFADMFTQSEHPLTDFISSPGFLSFFVAFVAGIAGVLSLTNAKSGALIGVAISITTVPAAAYVGVAGAYGEWDHALQAAENLALNLAGIIVAGVLTLGIQRHWYRRRRRAHLLDPVRTEAGLPLGRTADGTNEPTGWHREHQP